mgnify:CR=1 FL=1
MGAVVVHTQNAVAEADRSGSKLLDPCLRANEIVVPSGLLISNGSFGDRKGQSLGWHLRLPGLDLVAPDLRSERRRDRVMGEAGWQVLTDALAAAQPGRVLLLSSVPALGPRMWPSTTMR